jgi:biopolymer transport protein ExbD
MSVHSLAEPQINATPLIDVMLVLLVILIMTLPIATHAVKLNLPQGPATTPPPIIRLEISAFGDMYWNNDRVESVEAMLPRLAALARQSKTTVLWVVPDKRARYELVAQVLAAAQRSHVKLLSVAP